MAARKRQPGLDAVLVDDDIDAFAAENELTLVVPPARRVWPAVLLVGAVSITVGVLLGIALSDHVTFLQVALVVSALATAAAFASWMEYRRA